MIETDRLILHPLTYAQLRKYMNCDNTLEAELKIKQTVRKIPEELMEALENTILPNVADPKKNYFYSTLWTAFLKEERVFVGEICLYGEPNEKGEVEIGYGTYPDFRGKGIMTEMLGGFIKWIATQPKVRIINAFTDKLNISSFKVLEKNKFIKCGETETLFKWEKKI